MDGVDPALASLLGRMLDPEPTGRPAATAVASALADLAGHDAPVDGDSIPEEGTVVMATAVPSRVAAGVIGGLAVESVPPAGAPAPRAPAPAADPVHRRPPRIATGGTGVPAPAVLVVGLLLLAAVALGASTFGNPTADPEASAPPARTIDATPAPTVTAAPEEEGGNAGPANPGKDKDKDEEPDKEKGKGRGNGNGNGRGNGD